MGIQWCGSSSNNYSIRFAAYDDVVFNNWRAWIPENYSTIIIDNGIIDYLWGTSYGITHNSCSTVGNNIICDNGILIVEA